MKKYLVVWFLCLALIITLGNVSYARTTIDASTFTISPDGTSTNPSITFQNERTLGFYRSGSGVISVAGGILSALGGSYSLSDSDVAHGMTDISATNIYGLLNALDAADKGGLRIQGLSDGDAIPLYLQGVIGTDNPTDTLEAISLVAAKKNGTGIQALGALETVLQVLNNTTVLVNITGSGQILVGDSANAKSTIGLTINQGANNDEILSFKSSEVVHVGTNLTEADTFGRFSKVAGASGGLSIIGTIDDGTAGAGLYLSGERNAAVGSVPVILLNGSELSGGNAAPIDATDILFAIRNDTNGNVFVMQGNGNIYINDSANTNSTIGLTIQQGANDDTIFALKSSDVGHAFSFVESDTYAYMQKLSATAGGLFLGSMTDGDATAMMLLGMIGNNNPTDTTPAIKLIGGKLDGAGTGLTVLGDAETVLQVLTGDSVTTTSLFTVLGSGYTGVRDAAPAVPFSVSGYAAQDATDTTASFNSGNAAKNTTLQFRQTTTPRWALTSESGGANFNIYQYTAGWLIALDLDSNLNMGLATSLFGTNAAKVFAIGSGTPPTTSPVDAAQMWSADRNGLAGKATFHVRDESGRNGPLAIENNPIFAAPIITKGPAAVAAGFVGTVTAAASTTVTFSSAADAILAGYDASNPVLGVTLISNALTRYIVSWTNATTAEVDTAVTWAGTAITSIQFPESSSVRSNGTLDEAMLANGNKYFVNNVGVGTTGPGAKLDVVGNLKISGDYGVGIFIVNGLLGGAGSWTELQSNENAVADRYFTRYWSDYDNDSQGKTERFSVQTDGTTYIAGNVGIGTTAFGTNLAGGLALGNGTAATGTITGAQLWAANFNGASSSRFHTMTQEGQSAALATINETAIYYGVTWDESADTYTRTGRTAGHKTGATLPASMLSVQRMMERVLLNDDGTVNYVLSPTDSTLKIDGATASVLTGADGQVMVRIPKFWYRYTYTGTTHTWEVSPVALSGFDPHPAFYKDGAWVDYRYIGAYEASLYDVSLSAYVDGIHQTAVSAVFDTSDDSITIASRSNWATNLTVGQKLVITGTVSNNATLTVASLVSGTKITVSENLTDETAAATVIETQKDYTATTGDKLSSVSGKAAINYLTRANARVIAANRGAGWRQIDFDLMSAIQMLYLTEYASFYSQSMIGAGITAVTNWDTYNDYNPIALAGNSNSIGNATGNTGGSTSAATESTKYLSYRGIENWFGHLWKWVDGFNINDNIPYVTNNATNWADDTAVNYTRLVNVLGANITLHNADGYPATIQKTGKSFLAASVGASSSTKITDYYYQAAAWRVALFGGTSNNGAYAGGFAWHLAVSSGTLDRDIGGRLSF